MKEIFLFIFIQFPFNVVLISSPTLDFVTYTCLLFFLNVNLFSWARFEPENVFNMLLKLCDRILILDRV